MTLFVAARKEENRRFIDLILSFASKSGLRSNTGYATDDQGKTDTVIEAIGGDARLWVSNVTLSGEEPAPCERHFEGYPDPEQFEVRVGTQSGPVQRERQAELMAGVENMLKKEGFATQPVPWRCGAAAFVSDLVADSKN